MQRFLEDPDQPSRLSELTAFIGPNPESFLALYHRMVFNASLPRGDRRRNSLSGHGFSAPAFFLGPVWFFYRKMWLWAIGYVGLMLVITAVPALSRAGIGLSVAAALLARWAYLHHAMGKITRLRSQPYPDKQAYQAALAGAGGVSLLAGWISGLIFGAAFVLAVLQAAGKI